VFDTLDPTHASSAPPPPPVPPAWPAQSREDSPPRPAAAGQTALRLLAIALVLGLLADLALRVAPWGLNAFVLAVSLLGSLLWLQAEQGTRTGSGRVGYSLAVLAFAAGLLWRDAGVLKVVDVLGLVVALGLLASEREGASPPTLAGHALRLAGTAAHAALAPPLLVIRDVDWTRVPAESAIALAVSGVRGLALTLPVVILFAALLAGADPVFALGLTRVLDFDLPALVLHGLLTAAFAWIFAGLLRAAVLRRRPAHTFPARPAWLSLGRVEIAMLLASVDLLFAAFVAVQVGYLFGGADFVRDVAGLTYSEYARRGFFELVTVAALVIPLLLAAHLLLRPRTREEARTFAILAGVQVVLVLVMLASALERMRLYRAEYGLTELRFYTTAFMAWLGILLVGFLGTVLRGRRDQFARTALVSAFVAVAVLHSVNPDAMIVRANARLPRGLDVGYALGRSADAVPALLEVLPTLDPSRARELAASLLAREAGSRGHDDWRRWSVARARAGWLLRESTEDLRARAGDAR
jgi:hypothetical protein